MQICIEMKQMEFFTNFKWIQFCRETLSGICVKVLKYAFGRCCLYGDASSAGEGTADVYSPVGGRRAELFAKMYKKMAKNV